MGDLIDKTLWHPYFLTSQRSSGPVISSDINMGCSISKGISMPDAFTSRKPLKKSSIIVNNTRTVNVEKRIESPSPTSENANSSSPDSKETILSNPLKPPHHIPKLNHGMDQNRNGDNRQDISNINAASKGIAYELKIDWPNGSDGASIIKSHPPKALKRLEVPANVKINYEQLMRDLQGADERKAKIMKERKEQCQSRKAFRNPHTETRRTSLEFREQPRFIVTNVEIVHGDF